MQERILTEAFLTHTHTYKYFYIKVEFLNKSMTRTVSFPVKYLLWLKEIFILKGVNLNNENQISLW